MDEATFNWSNFYEEFATILLEYKNDRKNLISKLQNVYEEIGMKLPKIESNGEILDIDPFTIFGLFNKGITDDNRKHILGEIAKQFNLKNKVPFSFEGIPLVNNLRSTFFNFAEERGENDINNLWEVFESAIRYADNPTQGNKLKIESTYNNVIKQKGIQWNITMGLYWIRPNTYINLDSKNKYGWLIFISNIMMFTMGEGTPVKKFVSVEAGGLVGLLFTVFLMIVHSKLSAAGMGAIPALLISLAVILFFLIICSGKWPWLFNNTGFAYLTVATAAGNLALFVSDMRMHFIGFIIGSLIFNAVSLLLLKTAQIIVVKRYKDSLPQQSE